MKPIRVSWDDEWNVGTKLERQLQSDIGSGDERRVGRDFDFKKDIFLLESADEILKCDHSSERY